jgi:hypothetical protein
MNWKGVRYYPGILLERWRRTTEYLRIVDVHAEIRNFTA